MHGNYERNDIVDRTNLVINHSNVTNGLEKPVFVENGVSYIAKEDIANYFDPYIYYDEKYNQIITGSENKIAAIVVGEKKMTNNGSTVNLSAPILEKDDTYYLPFSALDDIYNVKTRYIKETDTVVIDSLNRKYVVADSNKNNSVKVSQTPISRTVDKLQRGENLVILEEKGENGWVKIRTDRGKIGYVKENTITNKITMREDLKLEKEKPEKVSLIWDYFYELSEAPSRSGKITGVNVVSPTFFTLERLGKGKVEENVGDSGRAYIEWAHENGYQIWPSISNNSRIDTTSEVMNDYKLRQDLINQIVSFIVKYDLDGINIDFENMYEKDKALFSRFLIELAPRLNEIGAVLSVDVTAPDGSETWSMCYDRHTIGKIADYIVFMAYDQHGDSSEEAGPNAGFDWVEVNLQKFVGTQEEIAPEKVVLGMPFYARIWWTNSEGKIENIAWDLDVLSSKIPSDAKRVWDEDLKQYVAEYTQDGVEHKVWIEDIKSIEAKLSLIEKYQLGGAAYWKKDGETEEILRLISEKLGV